MINEIALGWSLSGVLLYAVTDRYRYDTEKTLKRRMMLLTLFLFGWPLLLAAGLCNAFVDVMVESGTERKAASRWLGSAVSGISGMGLIVYNYGMKPASLALGVALVLFAAWSWADSLDN